MQTQVKIYTLGTFIIERDGQVIEDFITQKTALLFTYLALHRGKHSRESLASLLWSDTTDTQALKNLRTVLSSLRKNVSDIVDISRRAVEIYPEANVWVDAQVFSEGCNASNDAYADLAALESIAKLYAGDFLADVKVRQAITLDDWIANTQHDLKQKHLQHLHCLVDACITQQAYNTGIAYARQLVTLDPFWEVAQRQLMRLLTFMNQPHEAQVQYDRLVQFLADELGAPPEEETTQLLEDIKAGKLQPAKVQTTTQAVVLPDVPYIEPVQDIDTLNRMINTPQCRLLTLLGIGGIGKTSLATQVAFRRRNQYPDGAFIVPVTAVKNEDSLADTILSTLNVDSSSDNLTACDRVIAHLKKCKLLLVLDSYEHLLPTTDLVRRILDETSDVQLMVTSRQPLNLQGEWLLPIHGLQIRDTENNGHIPEAVRLFEITAKRLSPRFQLDDVLDDVIQICQIMDGLPLGIVIAAGWIQYLAPKAILEMLQQDLMSVKTVNEGLPVRHQGFQNLFNSMVEHLSEDEQIALTRLAIFKGSFDHQAAIAVADIPLPEFIRLVDKSLVQRTENFRYTIHNIVKQVFETRLMDSGEFEATRKRFTHHYLDWCQAFVDQNLPLQERMIAVDIEYHNVWHLDYLKPTQQQEYILRIAPALVLYWINRGYRIKEIISIMQQGINNPDIAPNIRLYAMIELAAICLRTSKYGIAVEAAEQALDLEVTLNIPYVRMRALRALCELKTIRGDFEQAQAHLKEALAVESRMTMPIDPRVQSLGIALYGQLGVLMIDSGNYDEARHYLETAMRRWEDMGESLRAAIARTNLGIIALKQKNYDEAYELFSHALSIAQDAQHTSLTIIFASNLAETAMQRGELGYACELFADALEKAQKINKKTSIINIVQQFSKLGVKIGKLKVSTQLMGFLSVLRENLNLPIVPRDEEEVADHLQTLKEGLGADYDDLWEIGTTLNTPMAIDIALSLCGESI